MGKEAKKQNKTLLTTAIVLFVAVVAFFFIYTNFAPKVSEGAKSITIEVVDDKQQMTTYPVKTDALYLSEAMKNAGRLSFTGVEGPYGLTLISINGVSADWEKDTAFWCIYVNGEMGNYGVDAQPVNDGDVFRLEYTEIDADA